MGTFSSGIQPRWSEMPDQVGHDKGKVRHLKSDLPRTESSRVLIFSTYLYFIETDFNKVSINMDISNTYTVFHQPKMSIIPLLDIETKNRRCAKRRRVYDEFFGFCPRWTFMWSSGSGSRSHDLRIMNPTL